MKIRYGFVSNSSSSSFIISKVGYPTVFSLALAMLAIRNSEGWTVKHKEERKIKLAIARNLTHNVPVTFQTCNYDTYIMPKDNSYMVSTCNNHSWYSLEPFMIHSGGGHDEGEFREEESKTCFWCIREGILGTPISNLEVENLVRQGVLNKHWCDKEGHFDTWCRLTDGTIVCPTCWHKAHPGKDMFIDSKKIVKPKYIPFRGVKLR